MNYHKNERSGELFALGHAALYASLPLFIVLSNGLLPPLFFAGASFLIAGIFLLPIALFTERKQFFPSGKALLPFCIGAGIIVLIDFPMVIFAGQKTSAGNIAILSQSEILFTFLFFGLLGSELMTRQRMLGALLITLGALAILLKSFSGDISQWDALIVLAAAIAPFANHFQKIALKHMGSISMVVWRNIIGGAILCIIGLLFEPIRISTLSQQQIVLILLNALLSFGIAKWFLFIAYKKIGVAKSIAINGTYPAITLLLAFVFLREVPTFEQIFGLIVISLGVYLIMMKQTTTFVGEVVSGDKIGTELGFPTINLKTTAKIPSGVYAARVQIGEENLSAVMHAGKRPTLRKKEFRIEIHLLEKWVKSIPETVEVEIVQHLRAVKNFRSKERLKAQIAKDIEMAKATL